MALSLTSFVTLGKSLGFSKHLFINDGNRTWPPKVVVKMTGTDVYTMYSLSLGFYDSLLNVRETKMLLMMMALMAMTPWCPECTRLRSTATHFTI